MLDSLFMWLVADATVLIGTILVARKNLTFFHPFLYYLFFHAYVITLPAWQVFLGGSVMYQGWRGYSPIKADEFVRAVIFADIALLSFTAAVLIAPKFAFRWRTRVLHSGHILRKQWAAVIIVGLLPVCLFFFFTRRFGMQGASEFVISGYGSTIAIWSFTLLIIGFFRFGFRLILIVPFVVLLGFVAVQGYHRFMLILPLLFAAAVYVFRQRARWPRAWIWIAAIGLVLVFPQLKYIGRAVQDDDLSTASLYLKQAFYLAPQDPDRNNPHFLDQYAGALTMVDEHGKRYFGRTYLPLFTLPIPRFVWPEKPGLADHVVALATPSRPYDQEGRVITYIAEAYLNFGIAGVIIVPFLLGAALSRAHQFFISGPPGRIGQLFYLAIMVSLIQVYRDGLNSIVLFGIVNTLPIIILWAAHSFTRAGRRQFNLSSSLP